MKGFVLFFFLFLVFLLFSSVLSYKAYALTYSNNMSADVVVGQTTLTENTANGQNVNSKGFNYVYGVATDGTHLFVSDYHNNRVLIYNHIPTSNNAPADVVIGQPDMQSNQANQGGSPGANTLNGPSYLATDGTHLFVVDVYNHRVLIYNHIPTSNNAPADVVIGQPDMQSNQANQGGNPDANTLSGFPQGVFYDSGSGKLFISDYSNNRVLIYNHIPTSNNAPADVVIGQPDMQSNQANQGGNPDANTISGPYNARVIQNKLLITEYINNRVLIFNSIPTSNNASADVVIGQPNMQSNQSESGGSVDAYGNNGITDVLWDGSHLLITDDNNNRILIYNSIPVSNHASADEVIGQPNFTSSNSGTSATSLNDPEGQIDIIGGTLIVGDSYNNRVVFYNNYLNSGTASLVLGQSDFTSPYVNGIQVPNSKGFSYVYGVATDGTYLFASDCSNNRVLIYNSIPTSNNASADVVIGQPDMTSHQSNQGGSVDANTLNCPTYLSTDGTHLFVADANNQRVLIYNHIPTSNNASADVVIGQPDMQSNQVNQGGSVDANTTDGPIGVSYDFPSGKLFIFDYNNNRILIYNHIPTSNNASADVVIGQPDMQSGGFNQGGNPDANTIYGSYNARVIQNKLLIADGQNNRILIYNHIPTSNNASADVVIGQPDMQSNQQNQGGSVDANTLSFPADVLWDGSHLLIQDDHNNRVLVYNSIPTSNNASADVVIGQPDMQSNQANQGGSAGANTLNDPEGELDFANDQLFVGDSSNNRVLIYSDDSVTSTPTPTPSSSGSSSSSSTSGSSSSSSFSCSPAKPSSIPDLFEIDAKDTSATLFITPVLGADRYTVFYGYNKDDNRFAAEFIHKDTSGVIPIKIDYLNPSTTYFFKVKAANGCAYGDFSNELSTTTTRKGSLTTNKFYKNFFSAILSFIPKQSTVNLKPATNNQSKPQTQTKNNSPKSPISNPKPISCAINFLGIKLFCK